MEIYLLLFLLNAILALDVYFVRHGARSPLVVPMRDVFKVGKEELTPQGKIQAYYYGKQLKNRHKNITLEDMNIYSTPFSRTRASAEYFLKGWLGINKKGNVSFDANPYFRPPANLTLLPIQQSHQVDQNEYKHLIQDIPYVQDRSNRTYRKYRISDKRKNFILKKRVQAGSQLCQKFQRSIPGSCMTQSQNQFFNFVDVMNCLSFINRTVPNVSRSDMQLPLDIINNDYEMMFKSQSFPTKGVQQDFSLVQSLYENNPNGVAIIFTHDTQLFLVLRSLLGISGVFQMFEGNMVMNFLSSLHYKLQNGVARMFFNDEQFSLKQCGKQCKIQDLFNIMNRD